MFGLKKLKSDVCFLKDSRPTDLKKMLDQFLVLQERVGQLEKYINSSLAIIQKDFLSNFEKIESEISQKYIASIERLFDFTKDTMMLAVLSQSNAPLAGLRRDLMMPELKKQWAEKEAAQAEAIDQKVFSRGEILIRKKKDLEAKVLEFERTGKKDELAKVMAQLEIFSLLEAVPHEKV